MLRPRWLAQAVAFGILCLGGAGLAAGLAQIHDNVSSTIFGVLTFAGSLILVFVTQTIENWLERFQSNRNHWGIHKRREQ